MDWVEIHTFSERNGPELNETSSERIPNGRYYFVAPTPRGDLQVALHGVIEALEQLAEPAHIARTEEAALLQGEVAGIAGAALEQLRAAVR